MARTRSLGVVVLVLAAAVVVAPGAADSQEGTVDCSFPVTATDATGTEVTVEAEPQRVVVLAPSAAQTMWSVGAEEKVVGMPVNRFTAYLNGSESRTNVVDDRGQPIAEAVVGAEPDLVLAPNVIGDDAIGSLRDAGLTVYKFRIASSLSDVSDKTRLTGRLVGAFPSAAQVAANTEAKVRAVRDAVEGRERPTLFYALGGAFTAGPGTFVGDVIDSAGADNVATRANISGYGEISQEVLAATTIDWILATGSTPLPDTSAINSSRAVARDRIVRVNANFLNQPAPRVVRPLGEIAGALYPDAMSDVDLDSVTGEPSVRCDAAVATTTAGGGVDETTTVADATGETTTVADATGTSGSVTTEMTGAVTAEDGDDGTTTAEGDAPGFGVVAALMALVSVALLARRRR